MTTPSLPEPDEIKAAEARGYSKGYATGMRRQEREQAAAEREQRRDALWQKFLAASIDFAFTQSTWSQGTKPINSIDERMELARLMADAAFKTTMKQGRLP